MYSKLGITSAELHRIDYTKEVLQEILDMYEDLYEQVSHKAFMIDAMKSYSAAMQKDQLYALASQIKDEVKKIETAMGGKIEDAMYKMADAVVGDYNAYLAQITRISGIPFGTAYNGVPTQIVAAIKSGKIYDQKWFLSRAIWGDIKSKQGMINDIIARGVAENLSSYEIAKRLEDFVNPHKAKFDWKAPGVGKKIEYNSYRLAKTLITHSYQAAFMRVNRKDPFVIGYRWMISNSGRVCELCIDRSESDHAGLGPGVYDKDGVPFDHPNGMCWLEPVMLSLKDIGSALGDWVNGGGDRKLNREIDAWIKDLGLDRKYGLDL